MKLRGTEFKRMHDAFLSAFNSENDIQQLLRFHLEASLSDVPKGDSFSDLVFNLIEWAERVDKVDQLLNGAIKERPQKDALNDLRDAIAERERHDQNAHAWFIESFTETGSDDSHAQAIRDELSFDYGDAALTYRQRLFDLYSRQRMLGKPDEVSISVLFTDVYVLERQTALRRFDIEELMELGEVRRRGEPGERVRGFPLVAKGYNLYILGKPGAGKTTFLKYITMQAAKGKLSKVPIFVSLNDWSNSTYGTAGQEDLMLYVAEQFDICHFPDAEPFIAKLLESGSALVLFDGLDEVRKEGEQRRTLTRLLQDFAKKYNNCQCLITCRIAASDYMFDGFRDVEVADFTPEQVETYAEKWFAEFPYKLELFKRDLIKDKNKGLAELCRSPLLLGMLCLYFDDVQEFPKRRAELYEEAIEALLKKWDSSRDIQRDYQALSARRKQQMFASIAAQTFEENKYFVEQKRLVKLIENYLDRISDVPDDTDGANVLRAIEAQHGIFVERAKGIYSFAHLTFQEYFAARYIVDNEARGTTTKLTREHLVDQRWREVFLLTADMLENGDDFVAAIREQVDTYVVEDVLLADLLGWANAKTQKVPLRDEPLLAAIRVAYISREFACTIETEKEIGFARAVTLTQELVGNSSSVLERALVRSRALTRARNVDDARSRALARSLVLDFGRVVVLVNEIANNLNNHVGADFGLLYSWQYASIFHSISENYRDEFTKYMDAYAMSFYPQMVDIVNEKIGLPELSDRLKGLAVPTGRNNQAAWQNFADTLALILTEERDFDLKRKISYGQWEQMNTYFAGSERLVQCLELATVSERVDTKAGLMLPPKEWFRIRLTHLIRAKMGRLENLKVPTGKDGQSL